jgi:hypothetical protein
MRKLHVLQCPSVERGVAEFYHEPCMTDACTWWKGHCTARLEVLDTYKEHFEALAPPCRLAPACRWHVEALAAGEPGCPPRRLGMLCEHQGGEWNTFEMAPPEEWRVQEETD